MTKNTRKGRDLGDRIADFIMTPIGMLILVATIIFLIIKAVSFVTAYANSYFGLTLTWFKTFAILAAIVFIVIMIRRAVSGKTKGDSIWVLDRLKSLLWFIIGLAFVVFVVYVGVVGVGIVFRISGLIFNLVRDNLLISLVTGVLLWIILARTKVADILQNIMIIGGAVSLVVFVISLTRMLTLQRPTAPTDFAADIVRLPIAEKGLIASNNDKFLFVSNPSETSAVLYILFRDQYSPEGKWVYEKATVSTKGSLIKTVSQELDVSTLPWDGEQLESNDSAYTPKYAVTLPVSNKHIHQWIYVTATIRIVHPKKIGPVNYINDKTPISRSFDLYVITPNENEIISEYQSRFEVWNKYNEMANAFPGITGMIIGSFISLLILMIGVISLSKDVRRHRQFGTR